MRKDKLKKVICFNVLLFLIFIGYYFLNTYFGVKILCPFHTITGYLCPGCGITRCLFSILRGDFVQAFYYNSFVFILLPFFVFFYLYDIYVGIFDKKKKIVVPEFVYVILVIVGIIFGVVRNII